MTPITLDTVIYALEDRAKQLQDRVETLKRRGGGLQRAYKNRMLAMVRSDLSRVISALSELRSEEIALTPTGADAAARQDGRLLRAKAEFYSTRES